ncbi:hypothetical protein LTR53_005106 [Teratosphaeriaceae sp. CCFEE 6253]|nr:hypothetical protein LTR53_005106 [Teratosphaeriaceae sp. CCFEE 6253]
MVDEASALAPKISAFDRATVEALVEDNEFFPGLQAPAARSQLRANIMALDGMIPSLYTFFEDLKYLEPAAKILKKLLLEKEKRGIRPALSASYFTPGHNLIECPEGRLNSLDIESSSTANTYGYQQL